MKNLIKLSILALLVVVGTESFAQTFGVKAGVNFANMLDKDDDVTYSDDYDTKTGFNFGPTIEVPLTEKLSFESGAILSTKGYKINMDEIDSSVDVNLLYLNIPLTAKATYDLNGTNIYGAFGPYVAFGLSGTGEVKYGDETEEQDINFGSDDDDDIKSLDCGLTFGVGVELNSIQIGLNYDLGLSNLAVNSDGGTKASNRVLGISVGYKFGKKK